MEGVAKKDDKKSDKKKSKKVRRSTWFSSFCVRLLLCCDLLSLTILIMLS